MSRQQMDDLEWIALRDSEMLLYIAKSMLIVLLELEELGMIEHIEL